jgi:transposase
MVKRYVVRLDEAERQFLTDLVATGTAAARALTHARVLLKADVGPEGPGWTDARIAEALEVSVSTIERVRETLVEAGLDAALWRRRPPARPRKLDGAGEAHLIAAACSAPPAGRKRWTLRLLADKLVELEVVEAICPETVRLTLKKTCSSPG